MFLIHKSGSRYECSVGEEVKRMSVGGGKWWIITVYLEIDDDCDDDENWEHQNMQHDAAARQLPHDSRVSDFSIHFPIVNFRWFTVHSNSLSSCEEHIKCCVMLFSVVVVWRLKYEHRTKHTKTSRHSYARWIKIYVFEWHISWNIFRNLLLIFIPSFSIFFFIYDSTWLFHVFFVDFLLNKLNVNSNFWSQMCHLIGLGLRRLKNFECPWGLRGLESLRLTDAIFFRLSSIWMRFQTICKIHHFPRFPHLLWPRFEILKWRWLLATWDWNFIWGKMWSWNRKYWMLLRSLNKLDKEGKSVFDQLWKGKAQWFRVRLVFFSFIKKLLVVYFDIQGKCLILVPFWSIYDISKLKKNNIASRCVLFKYFSYFLHGIFSIFHPLRIFLCREIDKLFHFLFSPSFEIPRRPRILQQISIFSFIKGPSNLLTQFLRVLSNK